MTACVPFIKPFLTSLESGFLRVDDENRRTTAEAYGAGRYSRKLLRALTSQVRVSDKRSRLSIELQQPISEARDERKPTGI